MRYVLTFVLLCILTSPSFAFSLENSVINLRCPQRGQIEVILHRYEHTQESWGKDNFETGGGHLRKGSLLIVEFANLDKMIYDQSTSQFFFHYAEQRKLVQCQLLSITNTYPINTPYYRE
jgi:hypothetical protein